MFSWLFFFFFVLWSIS